MKLYAQIGISILCGIIAFVLSKQQLEKRYDELELRAARVKVLAPKKDLVPGDVLKRSDLGLLRIYKINMTGHELKPEDLQNVLGQRLAYSVRASKPLTLRDLDLSGGIRGGQLANRIEPKMRAVTIAVDAVSSVAGLVRPNDHVDIIGTFRFPDQTSSKLDTVTYTLLQDVTILAVGQAMGGDAGGRRGYSSVTLSLKPDEAELIIFSSQKGRLSLTLRHPHDVYMKDPNSINFTDLTKKLSRLNQARATGDQ